MRILAAVAAALCAAGPAQPALPFIPVGVVTSGPVDPAGDRSGLLQLQKLRFTVIGWRDAGGELRLLSLGRLLRGGPAGDAAIPPAGVDVVAVGAKTAASNVRWQAWRAIARGARGLVFDSADTLLQNPDALASASAVADNLTRNAALFAPLQPRAADRDVRVDLGASIIDVRLLESRDAIVVIALNLTPAPRRAMFTFSPAMPEAIWQNMETGAAVNFVAGPEGPTYMRMLSPHDVLVLMIRKQYK
jgi:hypothetical protein